MRQVAKAIAFAFTFAVLACSVSLAFSFGLRLRDTAGTGDLPATAVVFTGQFDRIERGLGLLGEGRVERLFISGVNRGAGLSRQTFARQFDLSPDLRKGLDTGMITLATEAQDTVENALETSCWLATHPHTQKVLLITSNLHMPRASLLLEGAADVQVERLSTGFDDVDASALLTPEFRRFAITWFITFLPPRMWPARSGISCVPA
jgi:uncharacterized SAM-binding protein YcdF (DUF218 family)